MIVEVRIKKLKPEEVKVEFMPTSLSVAAKLATGIGARSDIKSVCPSLKSLSPSVIQG